MQKVTNKVVNINQANKDPWEIEWERCKFLLSNMSNMQIKKDQI